MDRVVKALIGRPEVTLLNLGESQIGSIVGAREVEFLSQFPGQWEDSTTVGKTNRDVQKPAKSNFTFVGCKFFQIDQPAQRRSDFESKKRRCNQRDVISLPPGKQGLSRLAQREWSQGPDNDVGINADH